MIVRYEYLRDESRAIPEIEFESALAMIHVDAFLLLDQLGLDLRILVPTTVVDWAGYDESRHLGCVLFSERLCKFNHTITRVELRRLANDSVRWFCSQTYLVSHCRPRTVAHIASLINESRTASGP